MFGSQITSSLGSSNRCGAKHHGNFQILWGIKGNPADFAGYVESPCPLYLTNNVLQLHGFIDQKRVKPENT